MPSASFERLCGGGVVGFVDGGFDLVGEVLGGGSSRGERAALVAGLGGGGDGGADDVVALLEGDARLPEAGRPMGRSVGLLV